jgi:hypothetical protein
MRDRLPLASGRRQENCAAPIVTRLFELRRGCSASCASIRSTATDAVSGSATTWRAEYMCFRKERMEPPREPGGLDSSLYAANGPMPVGTKPRFLQIVVFLTPTTNFSENLVGVTNRWQVTPAEAPEGRK